MSSATLALASPDASIPETKPHLMPFHIAHNGAAPIRTFFRVKPAKLATPMPTSTLPDTEWQSQKQVESQESDATLVPSESSSQGAGETASMYASVKDRFVAAFRGRTVQGLEAPLPEGYGGLVLKVEGELTAPTARPKPQSEGVSNKSTRSKTSATAAGRRTRRSARAARASQVQMDEDGDCDGSGGDVVAMECDGGALAQDEMPDGGVGGSRRTLKPVARFSSLVVWNPDIPVDEGRDEYLRALGEWTRIASDMHRVEDE